MVRKAVARGDESAGILECFRSPRYYVPLKIYGVNYPLALRLLTSAHCIAGNAVEQIQLQANSDVLLAAQEELCWEMAW